ncbi:SMC protein, putative, partial [Ixodes scapularis]
SEQNKYGESIEVTLKQVSLYFSDIFRKFVPRGSAVMIFTKDDEPGDSPPTSTVLIETEITWRRLTSWCHVPFCSRGPLQDLRSLSGGQKSVVALSFILALQKADPAPFYLFDEVDSHLDREQREALAQVLEELSDSSQFICSTFSPELAQKGTVFYVTHKQGASHVESVSQERALNLLQGIITRRPED